MNLDLHCHSVSSDDSRATVEQYLKWIVSLRKKGYNVDGIVLTEHRKFDIDLDYTDISDNMMFWFSKVQNLIPDMVTF